MYPWLGLRGNRVFSGHLQTKNVADVVSLRHGCRWLLSPQFHISLQEFSPHHAKLVILSRDAFLRVIAGHMGLREVCDVC